MSQTREPRQRRVWGRRTPPRGQPIPRHPAVRSRKSQSNQLRTCRTHLTLSTCVHRLSRHLVTYQTLPCDREMCNVLLSVWQEEQSCLQETHYKNTALYIFLICLSHLTDICCRTSAFKNHYLKVVTSWMLTFCDSINTMMIVFERNRENYFFHWKRNVILKWPSFYPFIMSQLPHIQEWTTFCNTFKMFHSLKLYGIYKKLDVWTYLDILNHQISL